MTNPQTWPGTAIIKTTHNAFNWRGQPSEIFGANTMLYKAGTHSLNGMKAKATTKLKLSPAQLAAQELKKQRHGGQYSKAAPSK